MESVKISAVLFANNLEKVADFYVRVLGMCCKTRDEYHWLLNGFGFDLVIHQIPKQYLCEIKNPPKRRESGAIRLDFPVMNVDEARSVAATLGGGIDKQSPNAENQASSLFLGYDPEGNVIGVYEQAC